MLDLNKIEEKIDAVLAKETNESLSSWLINKRNQELNVLLGSGSFISMVNRSFTFCSSHSTYIQKEEQRSVEEDSRSLPFAA
ncbi:MAG: hypothetical protein MJA30_12735 [Cytophagales bacterium]|nr:hypothetical protein [Cytophagales bacterium]